MTDYPDNLSAWELPPPAAREAGEVEPIRCFDSAEAALLCLAALEGQRERPGRRLLAQSRVRAA
jgi:hypothetical protein